jgi:hypothetical protein
VSAMSKRWGLMLQRVFVAPQYPAHKNRVETADNKL